MLDEVDNEMHLRFLMKENESGFQKAREEGERVGMEKGVEKGKEEGRIEDRNETVKNMIQAGCTEELILRVTDLSAEELSRIHEELNHGRES